MTASQLSAADVIALANEELTAAADGYRRSRQLQVLTFTASIISIFISNQYAYLAVVVALVSQATSWGLRFRAGRQRAVGDEGRMRGLLIDALGSTTEHIDLANLVHRITPRARSRLSRSLDPDYFASKSPSGVGRLRDHLQENSFWGKCLYEAAALVYTRLLIAFGVLAALIALIAIPLAPHDQSLILAKVLVTALTFGAALTQSNEIIAWRSAKDKIEIVDRRLEALANLSERELQSRRIEALFAVFGDYCVATAMSPPIPREIYLRERNRLNALWAERQGQRP